MRHKRLLLLTKWKQLLREIDKAEGMKGERKKTVLFVIAPATSDNKIRKDKYVRGC